MADQLYLSLWFPNFRLENLPHTLVGVLRQFAAISGSHRVSAASAYPIDFSEAPAYQRIYVNDDRAADTPDTAAAALESAVAEATEQLHDDMAYEFEMKWNLWYPEGSAPTANQRDASTTGEDFDEEQDSNDEDSGELANNPEEEPEDDSDDLDDTFEDISPRRPAQVETRQTQQSRQPIPFPSRPSQPSSASAGWMRHPTTVRILGFGPEFDQAGYAQNGHLRIDFGLDTPWTFEDADHPGSAAETASHIQQNIEMLLAFTLLVEKQCNISSRLLWTESGEPLAEKLIARLQKLN